MDFMYRIMEEMRKFVTFIKEFALNPYVKAEYNGMEFGKDHCSEEDSFVISSCNNHVDKKLWSIIIIYNGTKIFNRFYMTKLPIYLEEYAKNNTISKAGSLRDFDRYIFKDIRKLDMEIFYHTRQKSANK